MIKLLTTTEEMVLNPDYAAMRQCRIELLGETYPDEIGTLRIYGHPELFDYIRNLIENYNEILRDRLFLDALRAAGVDSWDGYADARDIYAGLAEEYFGKDGA